MKSAGTAHRQACGCLGRARLALEHQQWFIGKQNAVAERWQQSPAEGIR